MHHLFCTVVKISAHIDRRCRNFVILYDFIRCLGLLMSRYSNRCRYCWRYILSVDASISDKICWIFWQCSIPERQSARMSKITNDGLTRSGTFGNSGHQRVTTRLRTWQTLKDCPWKQNLTRKPSTDYDILPESAHEWWLLFASLNTQSNDRPRIIMMSSGDMFTRIQRSTLRSIKLATSSEPRM